ncbi:MAG: glycosyltransferase [Desulfovibrio sp.]|jgi:glycosyltransferase involved in cell wall biosynthesis|nr:glycosyltransferase [Desulfovibrio sp.]
MPKLRIIEVVNVRWFNAAAWYGLNLSRLLRRAGHDVQVICPPGTDSFAAARDMKLDPVPLNLTSLHPAALAGAAARIAALVRDFKPHIVNCHRGENLILWGLLKKYASFALIRTRGDQRPPRDGIVNRLLHTRLIDAVTASNSRSAAQCRAVLGVPDDRLYVIPGGVDTVRFTFDPAGRGRVRRTFGFTDEDMVVGLLGRFDKVKGHAELLDAAQRIVSARAGAGIRDSRPLTGSSVQRTEANSAYSTEMSSEAEARQIRLRLLFIGFPAGLSVRDLEQAARARSLEHLTRISSGRVTDMPAHISALDLGVIASQGSEAIARAALEIMACGVPLVGTDAGVMPDLLSPEAVAPVGDAAALTALLDKVLTRPDFRQTLKEQQRQRMASLSDEAFVQQTLKVYRATLQRNAAPGSGPAGRS